MIRDTRTERYLKVGDRLLERGKVKTAAAVYGRYADVCKAQSYMCQARRDVESDPVGALKALAQAEKILGPTGEGRRLSAEAYDKLGQHEIAERFHSASSFRSARR
jgi:hypothetical protein